MSLAQLIFDFAVSLYIIADVIEGWKRRQLCQSQDVERLTDRDDQDDSIVIFSGVEVVGALSSA